ncbi:MAG: class I SAM-dependent methyltransferase [Kofleriaceae bacterium]
MTRAAAAAEMLGNRLRKRWRALRPWAAREGVTCFRVYDRDIPEVPLTIDHYQGDLVVSDRRRFDDELADDAWLPAAQTAIAAALGIPAERTFVRRRQRLTERQAGHQYERLAEARVERWVDEGGHRFWINLSDYLDTGLFLDHRPTRARFAAEAGDRRVLNLFSYTGSFTVYAAGGGARTSTSVDLSRTYQDWAGRNWAANGLADERHRRVAGDVRAFLADARASGARWDLAIVDPPTFSNSKRMAYTWDVQRDHAGLLADVAAVMAPGAVVWFSTNRERFKLDPAAAPTGATITDETAATIPPDVRDPHAHRAWRIALPR